MARAKANDTPKDDPKVTEDLQVDAPKDETPEGDAPEVETLSPEEAHELSPEENTERAEAKSQAEHVDTRPAPGTSQRFRARAVVDTTDTAGVASHDIRRGTAAWDALTEEQTGEELPEHLAKFSKDYAPKDDK